MIKGIIDYLFHGKQNISGSMITESTIIQAGGDVTILNVYSKDLKKCLAMGESGDTTLLNKLIEEKISGLRDMILYAEKGMLSSALDELFENGISGLDAELLCRLRFYRFCQFLLQDDTQSNKAEDILRMITGNLHEEATWIKMYWQNPCVLSCDEFSRHIPEIQALVLEKMHRDHLFDGLICLYQCNDKLTKAISEQLCFYCGLSYFYEEKPEEAARLLDGLIKESHRENYEFFALIAKLELKKKLCWQEG